MAKTEIRVFLVAGQSNCERGQTLQTADTISNRKVKQWGRFNPNGSTVMAAFEPLEFFDVAATEIGFAFEFGKQLVAARPNWLPILVPTARGGTGFSNNLWNPGDVRYTEAINLSNAAMTEAGTGAQFGGILWHQGETDADAGLTEVAYAAALDAMVAGMRGAITGAINAPFLLGEMAPGFVSGNPGLRQPVQDAITDTPNRLVNCALASSLSLTDYDGTHFDRSSQITLGGRYFTAYLTL